MAWRHVGIGVAIMVGALAVGLGLAVMGGLVATPTATIDGDPSWQVQTADRPAIGSDVHVDRPHRFGTVSINQTITLNELVVAEQRHHDIADASGTTVTSLETSIEENLNEWWRAYVSDDETIHLSIESTMDFSFARTTTSNLTTVQRTALNDSMPFVDAVDRQLDDLAGTYNATDRNIAPELYETALLNPGVSWRIEEHTPPALRLSYAKQNHGELAAPAVPESVNGTITANDIELFEIASEPDHVAGTELLGAGQGDNIAIGITLEPVNVDEWFIEHVKQGERSSISVSLELTFVHPEVGITTTAATEGVTCELQTALLVDQEEGLIECKRPWEE